MSQRPLPPARPSSHAQGRSAHAFERHNRPQMRLDQRREWRFMVIITAACLIIATGSAWLQASGKVDSVRALVGSERIER